jgi:hypothetical protein
MLQGFKSCKRYLYHFVIFWQIESQKRVCYHNVRIFRRVLPNCEGLFGLCQLGRRFFSHIKNQVLHVLKYFTGNFKFDYCK